MTTIFADTPQSTRILAATETSADIVIRDGGMYLIGVKDLPDAGTVSIAAYMFGEWVTVDTITRTDLLADGANYSGTAPARLSVGNWRFSVAAAGPSVSLGAAGEG